MVSSLIASSRRQFSLQEAGANSPILLYESKGSAPRRKTHPSEEDAQTYPFASLYTVDAANETPELALEKAKEHLLLSFIPTSIPCREKERREVYDYLRYSIKQGGNGSPLYISGMPGTGKTATVREVIRELQGELNFKVVLRIPDNG